MTGADNDPTQAGLSLRQGLERVTLSLPEVQALATKAARGAGYDWGMAEEAGQAAAWLYAAGLEGLALLLAHLEAVDAAPDALRGPASCAAAGLWAGPEGAALCPLLAGAALSDIGGPGEGGLTIAGLALPVLLVPFLALLARDTGRSFRLDWPGGGFGIGPGGTDDPAAARSLAAEAGPCTLRLRRQARPVAARPREPAAMIDRALWARLDRLALRTCVPATDQSRADAGAGDSDND